jgi:predicted regulator of Ras-like GTPase activity (Roadblock/LC7/MglB family)
MEDAVPAAGSDPFPTVCGELAALRHQVTGVRGFVIAGVDGLLILHDTMSGAEPHDIAALAAGAHGISRTCGAALAQGTFSEVTIRSSGGYLAVYAVGEPALLAVIGTAVSTSPACTWRPARSPPGCRAP